MRSVFGLGAFIFAAFVAPFSVAADLDEAIALPSGRAVALQDVITDLAGPEGATARFRFFSPDVTQEDDWSEDMQTLCQTYAVARVGGMVPAPSQIVISVADRSLPFGELQPDAVQFFEAYSLAGDNCIWEIF